MRGVSKKMDVRGLLGITKTSYIFAFQVLSTIVFFFCFSMGGPEVWLPLPVGYWLPVSATVVGMIIG